MPIRREVPPAKKTDWKSVLPLQVEQPDRMHDLGRGCGGCAGRRGPSRSIAPPRPPRPGVGFALKVSRTEGTQRGEPTARYELVERVAGVFAPVRLLGGRGRVFDAPVRATHRGKDPGHTLHQLATRSNEPPHHEGAALDADTAQAGALAGPRPASG